MSRILFLFSLSITLLTGCAIPEEMAVRYGLQQRELSDIEIECQSKAAERNLIGGLLSTYVNSCLEDKLK